MHFGPQQVALVPVVVVQPVREVLVLVPVLVVPQLGAPSVVQSLEE